MDGAVSEPMNAGGSSTYEDHMKKQAMDEKASAEHPINVNGHSLKMGDLYSSHYDRKEMISKLNLMQKASGGGKAPSQGDGEEDMEPNNMKATQGGKTAKNAPGPGATDEPDDSPVEDQLFGNPNAGKSQKP